MNPKQKPKNPQIKNIKYRNIEEGETSQKIDHVDGEENQEEVGYIAEENNHTSDQGVFVLEAVERVWGTWRVGIVVVGLLVLVGGLGFYYKYQQRPESDQFYQIQRLKQIQQLPFCLVLIPSQTHTQESLQSSITTQNYKNYLTISPPPTTSPFQSPSSSSSSSSNYYSYKSQIKQTCKQDSMIMFINIPLKQGALEYLNQQMSRYRAWVFYAHRGGETEVVAFYYRIYQMLESNDFNGTNRQYLGYNHRIVQAMGMIELCEDFKKEIPKARIFKPSSEKTYFYNDEKDLHKYSSRIPYTKILRLSQDFPAPISEFQHAKSKLNFPIFYQPFTVTRLKKQHMLRAIDRQQLIYLPENHPIQQIEYEQLNQKYQLYKYGDLSKQVRFCVTVLSRNNIQNNRYVKVLKSIVQQRYDNYHVVFIDDNSTDQTMARTVQYMKEVKFPEDRVTFVQNLRRNYATYNIINAAYSYCHEDDVQMLIDGDDEFIGRYAFQVMNTAYQQDKDVWVAYSNCKNNYYVFGLSRSYQSDSNHIQNGKRLSGSFIAPIRTWRVKLIYSIPIQNHKFSNGEWLDTGYDDSLAHSLVELARFGRTLYIPQIFYEYNTNYGDNDNSNQQKLKHRLQIYNHVLSLPVLDRLQTLKGAVKQQSIDKQLTGDRGVRYKTLQV